MQKKLIAKAAAAFALAGGLTLASQAGASAAATVSVSPATGLTSSATVTGLTANLEHFVGLCGTVNGQFACDASGVVSVTTNASGAVSTPLTVKKSFTGTVGGGGTAAVDCGTVQCVIGVYNADGSAGATTNVSFS